MFKSHLTHIGLPIGGNPGKSTPTTKEDAGSQKGNKTDKEATTNLVLITCRAGDNPKLIVKPKVRS